MSTNRINVGTDYWSYFAYPNALGKLSISEYINIYSLEEFFFYLLTRICYLINNDKFIFFIIQYLTCYFLFIFYKKNKKEISFPLFILVFCFFFFPKSLNISRQILALSILLNAFSSLGYNLKNYILYTFCATMIHTTSIVAFIFLPYFYIDKFKKNIKFLFIIFYTLFSFISIFILKDILASNYIDFSNIYYGSNLLQIFLLIVQLGFIFICKYLLSIDNQKYTNFSFVYFYGILFFIIYKNYQWGFRISYYFLSSLLFLIPHLWIKLKRKKIFNIVIKNIIIIFYVCQFILLYWYLGYDQIFPFIFQ